MTRWASTTAYAALFIALGGFVLGILALLANAPITAAATVLVAWLGAYAANEWSYYFRDKEAATATATVVVNAPSATSAEVVH